jgi:hypothetical protein
MANSIHFNTLHRDGLGRIEFDLMNREVSGIDEIGGGELKTLNDEEKRLLSEAYGVHPDDIFDANVSHRFIYVGG